MELPKMVWMTVDLQNKELPIYVTDTPEELANLCGVSVSTVVTSAFRAKKGHVSRYLKVWIGDI